MLIGWLGRATAGIPITPVRRRPAAGAAGQWPGPAHDDRLGGRARAGGTPACRARPPHQRQTGAGAARGAGLFAGQLSPPTLATGRSGRSVSVLSSASLIPVRSCLLKVMTAVSIRGCAASPSGVSLTRRTRRSAESAARRISPVRSIPSRCRVSAGPSMPIERARWRWLRHSSPLSALRISQTGIEPPPPARAVLNAWPTAFEARFSRTSTRRGKDR